MSRRNYYEYDSKERDLRSETLYALKNNFAKVLIYNDVRLFPEEREYLIKLLETTQKAEGMG